MTRLIYVVLATLVVFDLGLVLGVALTPDLWFWSFHVDPEVGAMGELMLRRCGANWAAFLLFQTIALFRWRQAPVWLAVVAGIRLSDIFTDPSYALLSEAPTWFSWASLPAMGVINLALGLFFLHAWRKVTGGNPPPRATSVA